VPYAAELHVGILVSAVGDRLVQQVRHAERERVPVGLHALERFLPVLQAVTECLDLGEQRRDVVTATLCDADRLGARVAFVAQAVDLDLKLLAPFLELRHGAQVQ
jgi:hypothetical protein